MQLQEPTAVGGHGRAAARCLPERQSEGGGDVKLERASGFEQRRDALSSFYGKRTTKAEQAGGRQTARVLRTGSSTRTVIKSWLHGIGV